LSSFFSVPPSEVELRKYKNQTMWISSIFNALTETHNFSGALINFVLSTLTELLEEQEAIKCTLFSSFSSSFLYYFHQLQGCIMFHNN